MRVPRVVRSYTLRRGGSLARGSRVLIYSYEEPLYRGSISAPSEAARAVDPRVRLS